MPTTKPRHMVTETDQLAHALDAAALIWPELAGDRAQLLRKLIEAGIRQMTNEESAKAQSRLEAVAEVAGSMNDTWPKNWREELSAEWPA